jgi:hypothetical protein
MGMGWWMGRTWGRCWRGGGGECEPKRSGEVQSLRTLWHHYLPPCRPLDTMRSSPAERWDAVKTYPALQSHHRVLAPARRKQGAKVPALGLASWLRTPDMKPQRAGSATGELDPPARPCTAESKQTNGDTRRNRLRAH